MNIYRVVNIFQSIIEKKKELDNKKEDAGYNIFTLSSYNPTLENFHSDIIASILDPSGLHGEKDKMFREFINYLNNMHKLPIKYSEFDNPEIIREEGRIDIYIVDKYTKKAIIIENKINDAPDRKNQLNRYYDNQFKKRHIVCGILYITLRGVKAVPHVNPEMKPYLRHIAAFTNENSDLVNGWITPCINLSISENTSSLLYQYRKLLIYLGFKSMEKEIMNRFYKKAKQKSFIDSFQHLNELVERIPEYRADKIASSITNYEPFKECHRYKPHYIFYQDYYSGGVNFKLDVEYHVNGDVTIYFWIPEMVNKEGAKIIKNKLKKISFNNEMEMRDNWFVKRYKLTDFNNMEVIDNEVINFINRFLEKLRG